MTAFSQPGTDVVGPRLLGLVRHAFSNQYKVDREIGRGGAARVFLVVDKEQKLALKILHPEYSRA